MDDARRARLALLYSDAWMSRLKAFVGRKYQHFGDWEGWFEEAHQNLAMKIDQLPIEHELSDAMIFAVFKNELVSVKRHRLGYPRPRQWLREFSDLGQDLFEWMCLQRLPRAQVVSLASKKSVEARYNATGANEASKFGRLLEKLITLMADKKECDGVRPQTDQVDGESIAEIPANGPSTEENADQEQLRLVLAMILGTENLSEQLEQKAAERLASLKLALQDTPLLSDLDILVLRCYYFQGMSQNDIAKLIEHPLQKVVRRRESAIKRIRKFMEQHGMDRQSLL